MRIEIRRAKKEDFEAICKDWQDLLRGHEETNKKVFALKTDALEIYKKYLRKIMQSQDSAVFVALVDGKMAGHILVHDKARPPVYEIDRVLHVRDLYVAPQFRKKGIGTKLLAASQKWGEERGLELLRLMVNLDNKPAIKTYESFGFEITAHRMKKRI